MLGASSRTVDINGIKVVWPLDALSTRYLFVKKNLSHEPEYFKSVIRHAATCGEVLVVGSHFGEFDVPILMEQKSIRRLFSIEANPNTARILERIVDLNGLRGRMIVRNVAVAERNAQIRIKLVDNGTALVQKVYAATGDHSAVVEQTTLEEFCARETVSPAMIKLDIEGYELLAIRGARRLISKYRPIICAEVHPQQLDELGFTPRQFECELESLGYRQAEYYPHGTHDNQRPYNAIYTHLARAAARA